MKHAITILALIAGCLWGNAQTFAMINDHLYHSRVKLVSEFMSRFNGEESNPLINPDEPDKERVNLLQLFDFDYIMSNREVNQPGAMALVDSILTHDVKLRYEQPQWYAKVLCVGTLNGKEEKFDLYLTVEPRGKDMYKWVIAEARGEIFNLTPSHSSDKIMLLPNEHESNFMKLNSITETNADLITLYSAGCNPLNTLSVFNAMIYYGVLKIDYVSDLEYVFMQVPGYTFSIKEFIRDTANGGWLISSWQEMTDEQKNHVLRHLYQHIVPSRPQPTANTPATETPQETIQPEELMDRFMAGLNAYIANPSDDNLRLVEECAKGRYTFIITDTLTQQLCDLNDEEPQEAYRLHDFLDLLSSPKSPYTHLTISNVHTVDKEHIKPQYAEEFDLIGADLSAIGVNGFMQEMVVFFIYKNQIAGVKLLTDCY